MSVYIIVIMYLALFLAFTQTHESMEKQTQSCEHI